MTSAADALRPMWLSGITDSRGSKRFTTDSLLSSKVAHLNTEPLQGRFTIFVSNVTKIPEFFSHEANRFSSASFESLLVERTDPLYPRSTGWLLIRSYYSAFFALHSLMRLHGWACTRISPEACASLNKSAKALYNNPERICSGLYLIKATSRSPEVSFESLGGLSGGSHEILWSKLSCFLEETTTAVLKNPVDPEAAQDIVAAVSDFQNMLNNYGGHVWLTRVRNRVNYLHEYGAWCPYENSTNDTDRLLSVINRWRGEPSQVFQDETADELLRFCEACVFVVSLCRTTSKDLVARSNHNSPFRSATARWIC